MFDLITLAIFDPADIMKQFLTADGAMVYLLVFIFMIIESSFIPFPSEVIVPPQPILPAQKAMSILSRLSLSLLRELLRERS